VESSKCKFAIAWVGKCNKETASEEYCEEHKSVRCCVCGNQATHECSETVFGGSLVCGMPLCDSPSCKKIHYQKVHM